MIRGAIRLGGALLVVGAGSALVAGPATPTEAGSSGPTAPAAPAPPTGSEAAAGPGAGADLGPGARSERPLPEGGVASDATASAAGESVPASTAEAAGESVPASTAEASTPISRSLRQWYALGGPTMHPLALCSMLILAMILERAFVLRRRRFVPRRLVEDLREALEVGNRVEIKSLCERDDSVLGHLARIALEGPEARERVEARGAAAAHRAQRNLPLLASLGNLATMLGLLGTVLGMIEAFEVIARSGSGDARIVAGGIFRALVTTATGLAIGISALAAHALFSRRAADFTVQLESLVTEIADRTRDARRSTAGQRSALEIG